VSTSPVIPSISPQATPGEVKRALDTLRVYFANMQKVGGVVTRQELINTGLVYDAGGVMVPIIQGGGSVVVDLPTTPTGFIATGSFASIFLEWDRPTYSGHSHTEVWRAEVDNIGVAAYVGESTASVYSDIPVNSSLSIEYFYWIRHLNIDGVASSYNAVGGTSASTADSPEYVLDLLLNSKWKPSTAYSLGFIGYPSAPNGYAYDVVVAGTSGSAEPVWPITIDATVVDGGVTWKCKVAIDLVPPFKVGLVDGVVKTVIDALLIGDATITNAKIATIAADKITTGYLAAARIEAGTLNGNKIIARTLTADRIAAEAITAYEILGGTITGNKIAANTIVTNNIATGNIDTRTINGGAVTQLVASYVASFDALGGSDVHTGCDLYMSTPNAGTPIQFMASLNFPISLEDNSRVVTIKIYDYYSGTWICQVPYTGAILRTVENGAVKYQQTWGCISLGWKYNCVQPINQLFRLYVHMSGGGYPWHMYSCSFIGINAKR